MRGLCLIGALEVLEEKGYLKSVKEYIGISIGAIFSMIFCLGYTVKEVKSFTKQFNFETLVSLDPESALEFFEKFGIDSGAQLEKIIHAFLKVKNLPVDITFEQLAAALPTAPRLRVYAANLNTASPALFDATTSPTLPVWMAIRASMAVPFFFTPVKDPRTGHLYVDGGVVATSPFDLLPDHEKEHALSLHLTFGDARLESIESIPQIFHQIYLMNYFNRPQPMHWDSHVLRIDCFHSWMNFSASVDEKEEMIETGRSAARTFLERAEGLELHTKPPRRFSA
jgi:predicted acylesterase/phospholipase RssA